MPRLRRGAGWAGGCGAGGVGDQLGGSGGIPWEGLRWWLGGRGGAGGARAGPVEGTWAVQTGRGGGGVGLGYLQCIIADTHNYIKKT